MKRRIALVAAAIVAVSTARAEHASSDIDGLLRTAVDRQHVPMVVAMVADAKGIVYEHAVGAPKDAIFAIASMTKPVTSVAAMQLVEAGRVKLEGRRVTISKSQRGERFRGSGAYPIE